MVVLYSILDSIAKTSFPHCSSHSASLHHCSFSGMMFTLVIGLSSCYAWRLPVHMFSDMSEVTISEASSSIAGEEFSLTCSVCVVDYLHPTPVIQWSGSGMNSSGVTLSDTFRRGCSGMRTLTFNPLSTLHGAEYTCQAVTSIPSLNMTNMTATVNENIIISVKRE